MIAAKKDLGREEIALIGDEIYEKSISPVVSPENAGHYVVIDIETGDYEIDPDELVASDRLYTRHPEAIVWLRQIGSRYARRFGKRPVSVS